MNYCGDFNLFDANRIYECLLEIWEMQIYGYENSFDL